MIACSEMSDSSDSEGTLSEILTQEPTFPEAAEEALLNMNNRLRAEPLAEPLAEPGPIDVTLRAKYRSQIHELSVSVVTLRSRIKLLEAENKRLRLQNAALSGVPLMRSANLSDMRW